MWRVCFDKLSIIFFYSTWSIGEIFFFLILTCHLLDTSHGWLHLESRLQYLDSRYCSVYNEQCDDVMWCRCSCNVNMCCLVLYCAVVLSADVACVCWSSSFGPDSSAGSSASETPPRGWTVAGTDSTHWTASPQTTTHLCYVVSDMTLKYI